MTVALVDSSSDSQSPLLLARELKRRNDWAAIAALLPRRDELEGVRN
jgi:hypothetical protein